MNKPPHDPYLADALAFAMNQPPCIVICSSLHALSIAHQFLKVSADQVSYMKASMGSETCRLLFEQFENGLVDYLVTTTQLMYTGGFRVVRPNVSIACSAIVDERAYAQIASRIGNPSPDSNRLFLKGVR